MSVDGVQGNTEMHAVHEQVDSSGKPGSVYVPGPNAVDLTPNGDGGLLKEIIKEGSGEEKPPLGGTVIVHYVGTLTDGSKFDSSRDRGEKFEFTLGKGEIYLFHCFVVFVLILLLLGNVIKGWDIGVASMKRGELAVLYCKPDYAYGDAGSPPKIPPRATLVFEV